MMKREEEWAEIENKRLDKIVTAVAGVVLAVEAVIVVVDGLAVAGGEAGADAGYDSVQVDAGPAAEPAPAAPASAALAVALAVAAVAVDVGKVAKIVVVAVAVAVAAGGKGAEGGDSADWMEPAGTGSESDSAGDR